MKPIDNVKIRDAMTKGVIIVSTDATVREIANTMSETKVSAVIVTEAGGEAMGVISETDIINMYDSIENIDKTKAEDIMTTKNIETVDPMKTVGDAMKIMKEKQVHRLIVSSAGGFGLAHKSLGIISASDIIKLLAKL